MVFQVSETAADKVVGTRSHVKKNPDPASYGTDPLTHLEVVNVHGTVHATYCPFGEPATPSLGGLASMEGDSTEHELMGDLENLESLPGLFEEDFQSLLPISACFDPKFDPRNVPPIALLCETCCTALQTATYMVESEAQSQKLASETLRVRVWSLDLFDSANCTPLDELLSLAFGRHTSLRRHLTGVWADIAATLELVLLLLIRQRKKPSPEGCTQWRRLRIVLGLEDVSTAIHDGFGVPGVFDSEVFASGSSEMLDCLIGSLGGLIDCLFDLLVTIGTVRQLHKLGIDSNPSTSATFRNVEGQRDESSIATPPSSANSNFSNQDSSLTPESKGQETRYESLENCSPDDKNLGFPQSPLQDVSRKRSDGVASLSGAAVHDGLTKSQIGSVTEEDHLESINATQTLEELTSSAKNSAETPIQAPSANTNRFQKPIKFIDCHARTFAFPFSLCGTWKVG